jgi:hypothetical protein
MRSNGRGRAADRARIVAVLGAAFVAAGCGDRLYERTVGPVELPARSAVHVSGTVDGFPTLNRVVLHRSGGPPGDTDVFAAEGPVDPARLAALVPLDRDGLRAQGIELDAHGRAEGLGRFVCHGIWVRDAPVAVCPVEGTVAALETGLTLYVVSRPEMPALELELHFTRLGRDYHPSIETIPLPTAGGP